MKNVLLSLLSNAILLIMVVISIFSFWKGYLSWKEMLALETAMGLAYVFLSCYAFLNVAYTADIPKDRYPYFTYSFFMFATLKACLFLSFALMFYSSGSRIRFFIPICVIIASTEIIMSLLKFYRKLCFVSIYANYILLSKSVMFKIFAADLESVQFRHGIFYFVGKNGKAHDVRLVHIERKKEFMTELKAWLERNNISLNSESKQAFEDNFLHF
jgi:hypothetical protein